MTVLGQSDTGREGLVGAEGNPAAVFDGAVGVQDDAIALGKAGFDQGLTRRDDAFAFPGAGAHRLDQDQRLAGGGKVAAG